MTANVVHLFFAGSRGRAIGLLQKSPNSTGWKPLWFKAEFRRDRAGLIRRG